MSDTPPDVDAAFTAMFATRTPSERVRMMSEMFDTARRILVSNIRALQPDITDTELRVQIFQRTYGDDFTADARDRIVTAIRQAGAAPNGIPRPARHASNQRSPNP